MNVIARGTMSCGHRESHVRMAPEAILDCRATLAMTGFKRISTAIGAGLGRAVFPLPVFPTFD